MSVVGYAPYTGLRHVVAKLNQYVPLTTITGQRVYENQAPPGAAFPFIIVTLISAEDLLANEAVIVWTNCLWQVEFWDRTNDMARIAQGAALVHHALHRTASIVAGSTYGSGHVYTTYRERALSLPPEIEGDVIYRRGGGEYRQLVQAT